MRTLSIKIKIADREYPMTVKMEEEERIRKAGKIINERIRHYREQFGIDDKQDLLAMVAFDSLIDRLSLADNTENTDQVVMEKVQSLNQMLAQIL